jgi:hypothetical protein
MTSDQDFEGVIIEEKIGESLEVKFGATGASPAAEASTAPRPKKNKKSTIENTILPSPPTAKKLAKPEIEYHESAEREVLVQLIHDNIAVGLLTTANYQPRLLEAIHTWWNQDDFEDVVTVFSDTEDAETPEFGTEIPNLVDTGCESSYNYGIWCKNTFMLEYWRDNSKFKNVKWFVRAMDDSYLHLENILHHVSQYNHSEKIVFAEKWCYNGINDFPVGGSGFILSRAVVDDFNWSDWSISIKNKRRLNKLIDDMAWGEYLARRNISVTHHLGIRQLPSHPGMPLYRYWMQFHPSRHNNNYPWNMDFRPLLLHQHGLPIPMSLLHQNLHQIRYTPVAESSQLIGLESCYCNKDKMIRKCFYDWELLRSGECTRPDDKLKCIAPGPWAWIIPEFEHPPHGFQYGSPQHQTAYHNQQQHASEQSQITSEDSPFNSD